MPSVALGPRKREFLVYLAGALVRFLLLHARISLMLRPIVRSRLVDVHR